MRDIHLNPRLEIIFEATQGKCEPAKFDIMKVYDWPTYLRTACVLHTLGISQPIMAHRRVPRRII